MPLSAGPNVEVNRRHSFIRRGGTAAPPLSALFLETDGIRIEMKTVFTVIDLPSNSDERFCFYWKVNLNIETLERIKGKFEK